jgi:multidrug efflux pump subunit AcrB
MDPLFGLKDAYTGLQRPDNGEQFQERMNRFNQFVRNQSKEDIERIKELGLGPALAQGFFPSCDENIVKGILEQQARYSSPEYQEQMLEMADKYQTKKGIRQSAFNMFGSGMDNLMKGIGMSMNPYGTPEGLQNYLALTASAPQAMSAGYQALRNPMNIPTVQGGNAPTYF